MGSSGSKAARTATSSVVRKYPSRTAAQPAPTSTAPLASPSTTSSNTSARVDPPTSPSVDQVGPTVHTQAQASDRRTEEINLDARDPALDSRLSTLGPVKPLNMYSPSSTSSPTAADSHSNSSLSAAYGTGHYPSPSSNPAIAILTARSQIAEAVEREKGEAGRRGFEGRQWVDVKGLRRALVLRDEGGVEVGEVERMMGLKRGVLGALGKVGVVEAA